MPRVIGKGVTNTIGIFDGISGETITFYYRTPTTQERVKYQARSLQVKGKKVKTVGLNQAETRQHFGAEIITGVKKGDILYQDESGQDIPLTAETPGWKEKLIAFAPELVEAVALQVFEGTYAVEAESDLAEDNEDEAGEEAPPRSPRQRGDGE
ncbi:MAG: hypothetical protein AB1896_07270 [Thermodesulfobacteriota bacterium]